METTNAMAFDWSWIIALLIIGGFFSGNGFGFGNNSTANQVTNDFLYTNLSNQVRDNANAISTVDRDTLESKYDLNTNILQNRYDNSLQTQTLSSQLASCCCEMKSLVRDEAQTIKDLINNNTIQDLRDQLNTAVTASANAVQTQNILNSLGNYYPKSGVNPYYVYTNGYYGNGTTIY